MFIQALFLVSTSLFFYPMAQANMCQQVSLSSHLGTQTKLDFAHNLGSDIIVDQSNLQAVDPLSLISIELVMNTQNEFQVVITIPYSAPSFENLEMRLTEQSGGDVLQQWCLVVTVEPLIEITVGTHETWTFESAFSSPEEIYIQAHLKPVQVRFVSSGLTGLSHRIHGEGAVIHAPTNSTLRESGDSYQFEMNQQQETKGSYYCHNHQSSMDRRWIYFNVKDTELLRLH